MHGLYCTDINFFSVNHFRFLRQCFLQSWLAVNLWSFYLYLPSAETSCCFLTSPPLPPFLLLFLKTETCFKNLQSWLASNFWGSHLSCLSTMCVITSCRKQYFEFFFKLSLHQLSIDYPKGRIFLR